MKNRSEEINVDLLSNSLLLNIILKEQSCLIHTNTELIFFCLFPLAVKTFLHNLRGNNDLNTLNMYITTWKKTGFLNCKECVGYTTLSNPNNGGYF